MRMIYRHLGWSGIFLFISTVSAFSQEKLSISGKIRVLEPVEIRLENIEGKVLQKTTVQNDIPFSLPPCKIEPDVYWLCFGKTKQAVYLTNVAVKMKGFYNCRQVENSSLEFTGLDAYYKLMEWLPREKVGEEKSINPEIKGKLEGNMYSALAYIADMRTFAPNKLLEECMSGDALKTLSGKWLKHRTDSLHRYVLGVSAFDFSFVDSTGNAVRLSDFRGKWVLLDFCASWCGPCRKEFKNLLSVYKELKEDDLEFISISLDNKEKEWRKMLEEEKLPWNMLWDKEGFVIGNGPNQIQSAYGFYSIPFIVLIDKEGRFYARDLRGEKVKEEILKARKER